MKVTIALLLVFVAAVSAELQHRSMGHVGYRSMGHVGYRSMGHSGGHHGHSRHVRSMVAPVVAHQGLIEHHGLVGYGGHLGHVAVVGHGSHLGLGHHRYIRSILLAQPLVYGTGIHGISHTGVVGSHLGLGHHGLLTHHGLLL